jgi:hypothetical protein
MLAFPVDLNVIGIVENACHHLIGTDGVDQPSHQRCHADVSDPSACEEVLAGVGLLVYFDYDVHQRPLHHSVRATPTQSSPTMNVKTPMKWSQ